MLLEQLVTGSGEPVTIFAHGLAGDIAGTRPLGSAVTGRRVFFHFRGHGRSASPPGPWSFADLAADLRAVADQTATPGPAPAGPGVVAPGPADAAPARPGSLAPCSVDAASRPADVVPAASPAPAPHAVDAGPAGVVRAVVAPARATRAVGVSMGAAALARVIADTPDRFERVVFYLPAPLDGTRPEAAVRRVERLLAAVSSGDPAAIAAAVTADLPAAVRDTPSGRAYVRQHVEQLHRDGLSPELTTLWREPAVADESALKAFTGRALVLGCRGDDVHPAAWAERLAAALPQAEVHVYDEPDALWNNRADLRQRISGFLNA